MVSGASLRWLVGDIVEQQVDVLVCTANVWGNLSGGVNGALLARAGLGVQGELHAAVKVGGCIHGQSMSCEHACSVPPAEQEP